MVVGGLLDLLHHGDLLRFHHIDFLFELLDSLLLLIQIFLRFELVELFLLQLLEFRLQLDFLLFELVFDFALLGVAVGFAD